MLNPNILKDTLAAFRLSDLSLELLTFTLLYLPFLLDYDFLILTVRIG